MPPKARLTKTEIVSAALDIVRESGESALNARSLAGKLSCSTQPIFSNFENMDELKEEVERAAYGLYLEYTEREIASGEYPYYKSTGMAYIRFAKDEPELFRLLFMSSGQSSVPTMADSYLEESIIPVIAKNLGISKEEARTFHLEMWIFVHGIATMFATSYCDMDWGLVSEMTSDMYLAASEYIRRKKNDMQA
ncbi:MAG: TetR/AcrR family transcriptional regulator [Clostridia bacterium]|nr:TetR/AcrR family transcriptional regulator [Clostridia bacterium]